MGFHLQNKVQLYNVINFNCHKCAQGAYSHKII